MPVLDRPLMLRFIMIIELAHNTKTDIKNGGEPWYKINHPT
jgi:hypothetical protein